MTRDSIFEIKHLMHRARIGQAIVDPGTQRLLEDTSVTIMRGGGIDPRAAKPFKSSQVMQWSPGDTGRQRAGTAGTAVMAFAFAETAPTAGDALITVTQIVENQSEETLGFFRIQQGRQFSSPESAVGFPAPIAVGGWIKATVTEPSGATGISISLTIRPT